MEVPELFPVCSPTSSWIGISQPCPATQLVLQVFIILRKYKEVHSLFRLGTMHSFINQSRDGRIHLQWIQSWEDVCTSLQSRGSEEPLINPRLSSGSGRSFCILQQKVMISKEFPKHERDLVKKYRSKQFPRHQINDSDRDGRHQVEKIWLNSDTTKNYMSL